MTEPLAGQVVALIGQGSAQDRAFAMACAEAGANLALATVEPTQTQEFAMNSIANEAWAVGREQFVSVMDAGEGTAVQSFAEQTWDRYGRCDVIVAGHHAASAAPLDELSQDEWEATLRVNLTGPFLAAHAFGRLMERSGKGLVVLVSPELADADAGYMAARAGLLEVVEAINRDWGGRGVRACVLPLKAGMTDAEAGRLLLAAIAAG
ncbi:MAG: SDR family NAD(P)-dependent oxidoreductase [Dehalococcoidia bacterium]